MCQSTLEFILNTPNRQIFIWLWKRCSFCSQRGCYSHAKYQKWRSGFPVHLHEIIFAKMRSYFISYQVTHISKLLLHSVSFYAHFEWGKIAQLGRCVDKLWFLQVLREILWRCKSDESILLRQIVWCNQSSHLVFICTCIHFSRYNWPICKYSGKVSDSNRRQLIVHMHGILFSVYAFSSFKASTNGSLTPPV